MKKDRLIIPFFLLLPAFLLAQAVSINTDGSSAAPSAMLDVKSTDKGVLVPRMTSAQRAAIAAPATGLLVFDTDTGSFWYYTGTAWANLAGGNAAWSLSGNNALATDFLGTTNNQPLVFKVNNTPAGSIAPSGGNTFLGLNAGTANTTGSFNTATGMPLTLPTQRPLPGTPGA